MGLLNKIRNKHDGRDQKLTTNTTVLDGTALDGKPAEPAIPCSCGCPTFWRSAYGGQLRCGVCDPWPTMAMVGERWTLYLCDDESLVWVPALRPGEHTRDLQKPVVEKPKQPLRSYELSDSEGEWLVIEYVGVRS